MWQVGVGVVEIVDALGEGHHALVGVGGLQRGQLDAAHEEFLHLGRVVLVNALGDDFLYCLAHVPVGDVEVILAQCILVDALLRAVVMMMSAAAMSCMIVAHNVFLFLDIVSLCSYSFLWCLHFFMSCLCS